MSDKIVVWQPLYFPNLHYLARLNEADLFVVFDNAEFSRQSRQHRVPIQFGGRKWLTIPIKQDGESKQIRDVWIDTSEYWWKKHRKTIKAKYGGDAPAPFKSVYELELGQECTLDEFTIPLLRQVIDMFDIDIRIERASEVDIPYTKGNASDYLARVTDHFGSTTYYCGKNAYESYLNPDPFDRLNIDIEVQDWEAQWPEGNVTCLDVIYNTDNPSDYIV